MGEHKRAAVEKAVESSVSFSQLAKKTVEPSGVAARKAAGLSPLGSGVVRCEAEIRVVLVPSSRT